MQASKAGLRTAFRSATRAAPRSRQPTPFLRRTQRRFASRYQRFGDEKKGSSGGSQQKWSNIGPVYRAQYIWRNYRTPILVVSGGGVVVYVTNLEQVPITGRRRFNVISPETEKQIAGGEYENILRQFQGKILPADHPATQLVSQVVQRLLPSTGGLAGDEWRVHVINEPNEMNAFVVPGGKVFVFSGILPICKDENGLAAVLGHEIAHNVAHHVAERISQGGITLVIGILASLLLDVSGQLGQSIASLFLSMPNSRTQEKEADELGLLLMAESCYDPKAAIDLWTRMAQAEKGSPPQFLSTHPTSYNRRELIRGWLPRAEAKFEESGCSMTNKYTQEFAKAIGAKPSSQIGRSRNIPVQQGGNDGGDGDYFF